MSLNPRPFASSIRLPPDKSFPDSPIRSMVGRRARAFAGESGVCSLPARLLAMLIGEDLFSAGPFEGDLVRRASYLGVDERSGPNPAIFHGLSVCRGLYEFVERVFVDPDGHRPDA